MSTFTQFLGGSASSAPQYGAGIITNPKLLPRMFANYNGVQLKTGQNHIYDSANSSFSAAINRGGSSASIAAINTYVTLLDVASSGFLAFVITPGSGGTAVHTIRITADETESIIAHTSPANRRLVLGPCGARASTTVTDGSPFLPGSDYDVGFQNNSSDGLPSDTYAYVFETYKALSCGLPVLRFENSLKVEVQISAGYTTSGYMNRAFAVYRLD